VPRVSYLKVTQQQSKTQELSSVFLIRWTGFVATDNSSRFWLAEHILDPADDRERYVDLDFPIDIDSGWRNISLPQRMIEIGQKTLLPFEQVDGFCFIFSSLEEH